MACQWYHIYIVTKFLRLQFTFYQLEIRNELPIVPPMTDSGDQEILFKNEDDANEIVADFHEESNVDEYDLKRQTIQVSFNIKKIISMTAYWRNFHPTHPHGIFRVPS